MSGIRVGEEMRSWQQGEILIFDDSLEHEVWWRWNGTLNRADVGEKRIVLVLDIFHPDLPEEKKAVIRRGFRGSWAV